LRFPQHPIISLSCSALLDDDNVAELFRSFARGHRQNLFRSKLINESMNDDNDDNNSQNNNNNNNNKQNKSSKSV